MKSQIIPTAALLGLLAAQAHAGLLARYTFDNSAARLEDSSGNGFTGLVGGGETATTYLSDTVQGISTTVFSNAANASTSLALPNTAVTTATSTFSITGWMKTTDTNGYLFGQRDGDATPDRMIISPLSPNGVFYNGSSWFLGTNNTAARIAAFADGAWHHFAFVVDNTTLTIYRDGVEWDSMTIVQLNNLMPVVTNARHRFGADGDGGTELEGQYDDLRLYDHALTANEVETIVTGGDTDSDGLPDNWELGSPGVTSLSDLNGTLPAGSGPGAGTGDFDGDGLSDLDEYNNTTIPTLADTDGDNISDGNEVAGKDAAGVVHAYGATDPKLADSDSDTIRDDYELEAKDAAGVAHGFGSTDPNNEDTEGDGMDDLYELTNNLNGGLNPNNDDSGDNLDGDSAGWTNLEEYDGTYTNGVQTRADKLDTDADGLEDIVESNSTFWLDINDTGTNPTVVDSDNDGLNDDLENPDLSFPGPGITPSNSDPNIADTDFDGLNDGIEVNLGTDPAEPDSDGDTYDDKVEVLNGSDPKLDSSIPASTAIQAGTDFGSTLTWLNTGAGVSADASNPLLPGSGNSGLLNDNTNNTGAMVSFANPSAIAYYSIDVRYTGTLNGQGVNVVSSNSLTVQTGNFNHCALRFIPGGTFGYSNGGTFNTTIPPVTNHQAEHTYTVQFIHDIPNNLYTIRVYDRSASNAVIFEIVDAPTRNTTPGDPLYFGAGIQQDSTNVFQLRLDNLWVSSEPIALGGGSSNDFTSWANDNGASGQSATEDHDDDGVENGVEYFMGETGSSFTAMPVPDSTGKVSWPKNPDYLGTFAVQTSPDLATWTTVTHTVNGDQIEYTLPAGQGKVFLRLAVDPQ